jgi:hypothetical protein
MNVGVAEGAKAAKETVDFKKANRQTPMPIKTRPNTNKSVSDDTRRLAR